MNPRVILALIIASIFGTSCQSTSVRTFASPGEATGAIIEAVDSGEREEASRIFDSFARSSTMRDRVYAELYGTAEARFLSTDAGSATGAANVLEFVCAKYPAALNAREALVSARFLERAEADEPNTSAMEAAIRDYRSKARTPSPWVHLAATQVAIDKKDLGSARASFDQFLEQWDGNEAGMMPYVEDIARYLESH